jgi:hypothetical protein
MKATNNVASMPLAHSGSPRLRAGIGCSGAGGSAEGKSSGSAFGAGGFWALGCLDLGVGK